MVDIIIVWVLAVISGYFFPLIGNILSLATIVMGIVYGQRRKDRRLTILGVVLGLLGFTAVGIFAGQIEIFGIAPIQAIIGAVVVAIGVVIALVRKDNRYALGGVILGILALLAAGLASSTILIYGINLPPYFLGIVTILALVGFLALAIQRKNMKLVSIFAVALVIGASLFYFSTRKLPPTPLAQKLLPAQVPKTATGERIPSTPERVKALETYHSGKFIEAIPLLEKIVKDNPNDYDALYTLATAYDVTARSAKAIETLQKLNRLKPDYWEPYYTLGLILLRYGKIDQSTQAFKKAVSLEPKSVGAHSALAEAYFRKKQYNAAIDQFEQAIKYTPKESSYLAVLHNRLAQVYLAQKRKAEAISEWQIVLKIDPQNQEAKTNLQKYGQ